MKLINFDLNNSDIPINENTEWEVIEELHMPTVYASNTNLIFIHLLDDEKSFSMLWLLVECDKQIQTNFINKKLTFKQLLEKSKSMYLAKWFLNEFSIKIIEKLTLAKALKHIDFLKNETLLN